MSDQTASAAPDLAEGLAALVRRVLPGCTGIDGLRRLSAGATLQTWSFDAVGPAAVGGTARQPLILRRSPGGLRGHETLSLPTEAALITALSQHSAALAKAVPEVVHPLQPADGLGDGFVMRRIAGETIARKIQRDAPFAAVRPHLVAELGAAAGAIHRADTAALPTLPQRDAAHTLAQMRQRLDRLARPNAVFHWAWRWLHEHLPAAPAAGEWGAEPVLVHGDFRLGNVIVAPASAPVPGGLAAVLDWEIAHLGDPAEDLAWICLPPWRFGQIHQPVAGLGSREDLFAAYEAATGWRVDADRVRWWEAAGSLRWGLGTAGMREWFVSGRDPSVERAMIARRVSENELDLLRLLAPGRPATAPTAAAQPATPAGMLDQPAGPEVLDAVARLLRDTLLPLLPADAQFQARVAANALDLATREWRQGAAAEAAAQVRLAGLHGAGHAADVPSAGSAGLELALCQRIQAGQIGLDDPALMGHLWAGTLARMAIDQPSYAPYRDELAARGMG